MLLGSFDDRFVTTSSLDLYFHFEHRSPNMNDRWQVAITRKLNRQIAAGGERQLRVSKSRRVIALGGQLPRCPRLFRASDWLPQS